LNADEWLKLIIKHYGQCAMRPTINLLLVCILIGCASPPALPVAIRAKDTAIALNFLKALYSPESTDYRVIVSPDTQAMSANDSPSQHRIKLGRRLADLRQIKPQVIHLWSDDPPPIGSSTFRYLYDQESGELRSIANEEKVTDSHYRIEVRHWPDGQRLICLDRWLQDLHGEQFRVDPDSTTIRYCAATIPIID
jgi:hypothetical protein